MVKHQNFDSESRNEFHFIYLALTATLPPDVHADEKHQIVRSYKTAFENETFLEDNKGDIKMSKPKPHDLKRKVLCRPSGT